MRNRLRDPDYAFRVRWLTLLVLCLSLTIIGIDNTILNVALPTLAHPTSAGGLGASGSELQWIVDTYVLVFAGLLLTAGSLGDRFGRYRALAFGLALFGVGSILSAFAASASMLIGTRALMGVGAAFIMPATLSIITNVFTNPHERARAIGVWAGVAAVGIGIGPIVGGLLLEHFWWGSVFLINVPVVGVALVGGFLFVPDSRDPSAPRLDPLGSLLSIAGLTALIWAIIEGPTHGWTSPEVLLAFGIGGAVVLAFLFLEARYPSPMLDLRFFENPRFSAASSAIMFTYLALFGMTFLLTQYLQSVLGYSTVEAGATGLPLATMLVVFAPRSPRLVARFGSKLVVAGGMFLAALSLVGMSTFEVNSSLIRVILVTMLLGFGMAHVVAPATESIMGALPREKAGVGSAMNDTTRQMGGAIGVALLGSITASRFASQMNAGLAHIVPTRLLENAKESIGAALGTARAAPSSNAHIADVARASFVSGMHISLLVGAAIIFLAMIGVLIWLPAHAAEPGTAHASVVDAVPAGVTSVDVIPAEPLADLAEEIAYEHEHR
jgi:EmrB/QacA subfamily drug resistance transporter